MSLRTVLTGLSPFWLAVSVTIGLVLLVGVVARRVWILRRKHAPDVGSADASSPLHFEPLSTAHAAGDAQPSAAYVEPPSFIGSDPAGKGFTLEWVGLGKNEGEGFPTIDLFHASGQASRDDSTLLEETLAELDRAEPGWRIADLQRNRPAVADRGNSALRVMAARKLLPADWPTWSIEVEKRDADGAARQRQEFDAGLNSRAPTAELTAGQVAVLRAELHRASAALAAARELADLPAGRFPIDWSGDLDEVLAKLPLQDARVIAGLLEYDAVLRAQDRDFATALASCRAALNAGRSIGDEMTLVAQLIRIACGVSTARRVGLILNQGEPPAAGLAALQALLEDEAEEPLLRYATPGERAVSDWYLQAIQERRKTADDMHGADILQVGEAALREARQDLRPDSIRRTRAILLRFNADSRGPPKLPK